MSGSTVEQQQPPDDDNNDLREAVFGKKRVGLLGLVSTVGEQHEDLIRERDARAVADKQLWKAVKENTRRIDRMVWIAIGIGAGSGAAFLGTLLGG